MSVRSRAAGHILPSIHRAPHPRCLSSQHLHRRHSTQTQVAVTMGKIERITMFKIPREEDRNRALQQYRVLKKTAVKVWQIV
jgi:hypothetical protein